MPPSPRVDNRKQLSPAGYRILPEIYDRWQVLYGSDYSALILPRLLSTLDRIPVPEKSIVDVACGTGTLALMMARRGWQASGVDASPGMIDASRRKAVEFGQPVRFSCQDMRSFVLPERVGLVTSFYDSVNHLLTLRDIRSFFRSASRALRFGGLLIFDVNNEACYRKLWKGTTTMEHADFTLVLNNSYTPSRSIARSKVLVQYHGTPAQPPVSETVEERCFTHDELSRALAREGFTLLTAEDFAFSTAPEFGKLKTWWVARVG
ncbi:MAG TPA: class I SAM-dependent methyltransferase [Bacteroidota bacterium]|nr:class I SAM-dependent methyltransferase [Bacteroidota bacterium]